jgi:hypothetical protein
MSDDEGDEHDDTIGDADVNHLQFWQICDDNPVLQLPADAGHRYVVDARGALLCALSPFALVALVEPSQRSILLAPVADLLLVDDAADFVAKTRRAKRLRFDANSAIVGVAASADACVLAVLTSESKALLLDVRRAWHAPDDDDDDDARTAAALFHTVEHVNGVRSVSWSPTHADAPHLHCLAMCCGKALAFVVVDSRACRAGEMTSFGSNGVPPAAICWRDAPATAAVVARLAAVALHDGSVALINVTVDAKNPLAKPGIKLDKRIIAPRSLPVGSPTASLAWPVAEHLVVGYRTKPIEEDDDPLPYYVIDPRDESPSSLGTVLIRLAHDRERPAVPLVVSLDKWRFFVLADTAASIISTIGINTLTEEAADAPLLLFPEQSVELPMADDEEMYPIGVTLDTVVGFTRRALINQSTDSSNDIRWPVLFVLTSAASLFAYAVCNNAETAELSWMGSPVSVPTPVVKVVETPPAASTAATATAVASPPSQQAAKTLSDAGAAAIARAAAATVVSPMHVVTATPTFVPTPTPAVAATAVPAKPKVHVAPPTIITNNTLAPPSSLAGVDSEGRLKTTPTATPTPTPFSFGKQQPPTAAKPEPSLRSAAELMRSAENANSLSASFGKLPTAPLSLPTPAAEPKAAAPVVAPVPATPSVVTAAAKAPEAAAAKPTIVVKAPEPKPPVSGATTPAPTPKQGAFSGVAANDDVSREVQRLATTIEDALRALDGTATAAARNDERLKVALGDVDALAASVDASLKSMRVLSARTGDVRVAVNQARASNLAVRGEHEHARALLDARHDRAYHRLLRGRRLDPESAAVRARVRPSFAAIDNGVRSLEQHMYVLRNNEEAPAPSLPSYEKLYRMLETHCRVLAQQVRVIDDLTARATRLGVSVMQMRTPSSSLTDSSGGAHFEIGARSPLADRAPPLSQTPAAQRAARSALNDALMRRTLSSTSGAHHGTTSSRNSTPAPNRTASRVPAVALTPAADDDEAMSARPRRALGFSKTYEGQLVSPQAAQKAFRVSDTSAHDDVDDDDVRSSVASKPTAATTVPASASSSKPASSAAAPPASAKLPPAEPVVGLNRSPGVSNLAELSALVNAIADEPVKADAAVPRRLTFAVDDDETAAAVAAIKPASSLPKATVSVVPSAAKPVAAESKPAASGLASLGAVAAAATPAATVPATTAAATVAAKPLGVGATPAPTAAATGSTATPAVALPSATPGGFSFGSIKPPSSTTDATAKPATAVPSSGTPASTFSFGSVGAPKTSSLPTTAPVAAAAPPTSAIQATPFSLSSKPATGAPTTAAAPFSLSAKPIAPVTATGDAAKPATASPPVATTATVAAAKPAATTAGGGFAFGAKPAETTGAKLPTTTTTAAATGASFNFAAKPAATPVTATPVAAVAATPVVAATPAAAQATPAVTPAGTPMKGNLFGAPTATGAAVTPAPTVVKSLFGTTPATASTPAAATPKPVFGAGNTATPGTPGFAFGAGGSSATAPPTTSSLFGKPSTTPATGAAPTASTTSAAPTGAQFTFGKFGAAGGGAPAASGFGGATPFGGGATASGFGGTPAASGGNQPASLPFGAPATTSGSQSAFGAAASILSSPPSAAQPPSSLFGNAGASGFGGGAAQPSPFGGSAAAAQPSAFGAAFGGARPAGAAPPFGGQPSAFGGNAQPAGFGAPAQPSPFGGGAPAQTSPNPLFGGAGAKPATSFGNSFGGRPTQLGGGVPLGQPTNVFAKPAASVAPTAAFATAAAQGASPFAVASQASPFGGAAAGGSPFGGVAAGGAAGSGGASGFGSTAAFGGTMFGGATDTGNSRMWQPRDPGK